MSSLHLYGPSAFLLPVYGTGELAQAFCRFVSVRAVATIIFLNSSSCAVAGGTYVMGKSVTLTDTHVCLDVEDVELQKVLTRCVVIADDSNQSACERFLKQNQELLFLQGDAFYCGN